MDPEEPQPCNSKPARSSESKTAAVERQLRHLIARSSAAGLSHAMSAASPFARGFWTLLIVCGLCGLFLNMSVIIQRYLRGPVLIQMQNRENAFRWPSITLCNPSSPFPFSVDPRLRVRWKSLERRVDALGEWKRSVKGFWQNIIQLSSMKAEDVTMGLEAFTDEGLIKVGVDQNDIPRAAVDNFEKAVRVTRDIYSVQWYFSDAPTICYSLNVSKAVRRIHPNATSGQVSKVEVLLKLPIEDYHFFNAIRLRQVLLFITHPRASLNEAHASRLAMGREIVFEISSTRTIRLFGKSKCRCAVPEVEIFDPTLTNISTVKETFSDCKFFHIQKRTLSFCNCYHPYFPIYRYKELGRYPLCLDMTRFNDRELEKNVRCMENITGSRNHTEALKKEFSKSCLHLKQEPCDNLGYYFRFREFPFSEELTEKLFHNLKAYYNVSDRSMWKNLTQSRLKLSFIREREYTSVVVEEYAYPFSNFLSDTGGLLGLWVGLSVVSLFELIEIWGLFLQYLSLKLCKTTTSV